MTTDDGRKVYRSAQELITQYRLDAEKIEGTGKDGAVTKSDVRDYLRGEHDELPSQRAQVLYLVTEGRDNAEVAEHIRSVRPDSGIQPSHVSIDLGEERRRETEWWTAEETQEALREHRPTLKGVEAPEAEGKE